MPLDYHWSGNLSLDAKGGGTFILYGVVIVCGVICIGLLLGALL